jgi:hypothetical protein
LSHNQAGRIFLEPQHTRFHPESSSIRDFEQRRQRVANIETEYWQQKIKQSKHKIAALAHAHAQETKDSDITRVYSFE